MKPIAITQEMVADLEEGATVITYAAPEGTEDQVNDVQGIFELGVPFRFGTDKIYIPMMPDVEELAALNRGEPMWFVMLSHRMPVFQAYVAPLPGLNLPLVGGPLDGEQTDRNQADLLNFDGSIYAREFGGYVWQGYADGFHPENAGMESVELPPMTNPVAGTDSEPADG